MKQQPTIRSGSVKRKIHCLESDPEIPSPETYKIHSKFDERGKGYSFGSRGKDFNQSVILKSPFLRSEIPGPGQYNTKEEPRRKKILYFFPKVKD